MTTPMAMREAPWLVRFGLARCQGLRVWKCDLYRRHDSGRLEWRAGYTGHPDEAMARERVLDLLAAHTGGAAVDWVEDEPAED